MTVPELIERSGVSTGAAYRVVDFLERQALVERGKRGPITAVDWRSMLERWAEDYEPQLEQPTVRLLAPRGLGEVKEALALLERPSYVLTGSLASGYFESYAQARSASIYTDDSGGLAKQIELRPVETGANVLLLQPSDDVVFARAKTFDGVRIAAPSQIAVDLLNGPGRAPAEAEALLDWMTKNESSWRR
jgi:hypothetical protein